MSGVEVGLEVLACDSIDELASVCHSSGYRFAVSPILKMGTIPVHDSEQPLPASFAHTDLILAGPEHATSCVGCIAPWIDLESTDPHILAKSQTLVRQQVHWAAHIGLPAVQFYCPLSGPMINFARSVDESLSALSYQQVFVRFLLGGAGSDCDGWTRWNKLRMLSRHNPKLQIALELQYELPDEAVLDKWLAEPIKLVVLPTSIFLSNNAGFPVLSKRHQAFVRKLMQTLEPRFVISSESFARRHRAGSMGSYCEYIHHLHRSLPVADAINQFAAGYQDYLQAPLQPLMDNLDSATYEVFEKDPIKYQEYERAVYRALIDRVPKDSSIVTVIMVVGAGRGPLVDRSLKAASESGRKVKVYAVEKNANAVVGLRQRKEQVWGDQVTVVHIDMRYWRPEEKADILVSELLGSFGDNELSPECLDGAQALLKQDGVSIPSSYTAFISPLSSQKLFNEAAAYNDEEHMQMPYVVKFRSVHEIAEPSPLWVFEHPVRSPMRQPGHPHFNQHNTRYSSATFEVTQDTVMHGLAGYFEAVLYKDVMISIHPKTHSEGMFSWFPIFFPIRVPVFLPKASSIQVHFWRLD
ncbi:PRMT5 arginine-N-methyltransferase-domain-containing protein [Entophlyctis helioformis]|nr:PRMT5 arginine-N-methyltransferase-domain-containing protein [Entophlyctis helioformis]